MQLAPQSVDKLQNAAGLGFDNRFHHHLPTGIPHGDHNRFLVRVHSDIFNVTTHVSCLLGGKVIRANAYLSPRETCHSSGPPSSKATLTILSRPVASPSASIF